MSPELRANGRYSAHLALRGVGAAGQSRIAAGRVALIGLGGLGCAVSQYLASSGLGHLSLCDFDRIETGNLARQVLYSPGDTGERKVDVAASKLASLNPDLKISVHPERVDTDNAARLFLDHDLCIDASDNYGTRLVMNRAALETGRPWLMGSCVRMEGQFALFQPRRQGACYRCAYGTTPDTLEDCPGAGVFAPVAGVMGTAMALQALKFLVGLDVDDSMHLLDAESWQWRKLKLRKLAGCQACSDLQET